MLARGQVTYLYFMVIDNVITLLDARDTPVPDAESLYIENLEKDHSVSANWEAVGAQTIIINRQDKVGVEVAIPFEPLFDVKLKLREQTIAYAKNLHGQNRVDWVELYAWKHDELVGIMTFSRDDKARWYPKDTPVERSVNARSTPLGLPGGPCHIIRKVEESNLTDRVKEELIIDIQKGKDLSNDDEKLLYQSKVIPSRLALFKHLRLTSHVQFRMDQRGITVPEVESALAEFTKWYTYRVENKDKMSPQDKRLIQEISQGDSVRFDASKAGITIVFVVDARRKKARLVSTWWTNQPNPPKPRPGECEVIEYLDRDRTPLERPKILGSMMQKELLRMAAHLRQRAGQCGGNCECGDQCKCGGKEGECGCGKKADFRGMREMLLKPTDWSEAQEDDYWYDDDRKD